MNTVPFVHFLVKTRLNDNFFLAQSLITVASSRYIERGGADKQQYYSRPKGDISPNHMHKQRQAQRSTNRVTEQTNLKQSIALVVTLQMRSIGMLQAS